MLLHGFSNRQVVARAPTAAPRQALWLLCVGYTLALTAGSARALAVTCADSSSVQITCVENGATVTCGEEMTTIISYLAVPNGSGPFPGVLYNHGGFGAVVGGDLLENAGQLACAGYIAYSKRREGTSVPDTQLEVEQGLSEFKVFAGTQLDLSRLAIMGYSRGGLLVLAMAETHSGEFDAAIMLAPAPGSTEPWGSGNTAMDTFLLDVGDIDPGTAFLILVAANDLPPDNPVNDLVDLATTVHTAVAGIVTAATLDVRPAWLPGVTQGGHNLFQAEPPGQPLSTDPGHYWREVIAHLDLHVAGTAGLPALGPPGLALAISALLLAGLGPCLRSRLGGEAPS